jgi:hypothetical protein
MVAGVRRLLGKRSLVPKAGTSVAFASRPRPPGSGISSLQPPRDKAVVRIIQGFNPKAQFANLHKGEALLWPAIV